jgi:lipoprotein-releasing system ATP-binding protein
VLQATHLTKTYPSPAGDLAILTEVSLSLAGGEAAAITGPSGSGKSTLLYVLGALEPPTSGVVTLDGQNPYDLDAAKLAAFRNRQVGFVFQDHCLLPQCSVIENVLVPTLVGDRDGNAAGRAKHLLEQVGLADRLAHRPAELSGGEKQRAAIARALIRQPRLLLCDEPTGNLDADTAARVAELLLTLHERQQTMMIVVTHSEGLAARFRKRWRIARGQLTT